MKLHQAILCIIGGICLIVLAAIHDSRSGSAVASSAGRVPCSVGKCVAAVARRQPASGRGIVRIMPE